MLFAVLGPWNLRTVDGRVPPNTTSNPAENTEDDGITRLRWPGFPSTTVIGRDSGYAYAPGIPRNKDSKVKQEFHERPRLKSCSVMAVHSFGRQNCVITLQTLDPQMNKLLVKTLNLDPLGPSSPADAPSDPIPARKSGWCIRSMHGTLQKSAPQSIPTQPKLA